MNTYIRKMKKNSKALSPVVASIILIAVTVAVSVVVAAWMGGMTIGLMGSTEQATVTNVALSNGGSTGAYTGTAVVSIKNTGSATVTISSATIDGKAATVGATTTTIAKGTSADITLTIPTSTGTALTAAPFVDGAQYVIKMQTAKGNTITYTATYTAP
jgi:archaeal type IV pilus assembly protein PilA